MQLQFQDRVSQMMTHVQHNIGMLPGLLDENRREHLKLARDAGGSNGGSAVPSLLDLAADAVARNPLVLLARPGILAAMGERCATVLLLRLLQRRSLTFELVVSFRDSGYESLADLLHDFDLLAGVLPSPKTPCREGCH